MKTVSKKFWFLPLLIVIGMSALLMLLPGLFGVKSVVLWTDRFIYLLMVAVIFLLAYIRYKPHLRLPWRHVLANRRALIALVILSAYVCIGLLDSIHYRQPLSAQQQDRAEQLYSVEVFSAFDALLTHLRERTEKTYSEPFAYQLYAKETLNAADGSQYRDFPRLLYGAAHLTDPARQRSRDILFKALSGAGQGVILFALLLGGVLIYLAQAQSLSLAQSWQQYRQADSAKGLRMVMLTLAGLIIFSGAIWELSFFYHVFGTDKVGQDVLYLGFKSIRTGLVIGTLTTLIMLPFAILLGIMAGYFRGWVDDLIQYIYTTLSSVPAVLLIAAAVLSIQVYMANHPELFESVSDQADMKLLALCVVLGITSWTGLCRLLRGETLKLREMDYIQAATAFGVGHFTIIGRHLLPNVLHIVLIMVVLDFSGLVLAEAVLSYVGVGVDPSTISWGNMINGARLELAREPVVWWSLVAAFVFMFTLVLAANLFSDAVRDAFDPRLNQRGKS
ncbi:ABC transporter, permease protein 2 (cluster 5, nickel/peptides/opines) [hydrothermal vent metagenome]|uniref:ABC transporter, permease protein 2 (Cluster 5, nickel/peptides/opines) n=1 Tax=hydrothermal vent metagenome TaxID=652676 RepID=A0A3B1BJQ9_9ZZZZ